MTDAWCYRRSRDFKAAVAEPGAVQRVITPHRPWTNGKAERFTTQWAYARVFDSSAQRVDSLPAWLHGYNHHRPHTALAGKPPVSRITNVPRFDTPLRVTLWVRIRPGAPAHHQ